MSAYHDNIARRNERQERREEGTLPGKRTLGDINFGKHPKNPRRRAPERSTMSEQTTPTAEALMEGIGAAERAGKAPYARLIVGVQDPKDPHKNVARTLAYADDRKDGFVLSIAKGDVENAPKRFAKMLENGGKRATVHVTAKNVKGARALVEWLARQV